MYDNIDDAGEICRRIFEGFTSAKMCHEMRWFIFFPKFFFLCVFFSF